MQRSLLISLSASLVLPFLGTRSAISFGGYTTHSRGVFYFIALTLLAGEFDSVTSSSFYSLSNPPLKLAKC